MQSRAKMHHVAVLIGKFVKSKYWKVLLRFSSTLINKFGFISTPGDNWFVMSSSSSFNVDCNWFPDAWALGFCD